MKQIWIIETENEGRNNKSHSYFSTKEFAKEHLDWIKQCAVNNDAQLVKEDGMNLQYLLTNGEFYYVRTMTSVIDADVVSSSNDKRLRTIDEVKEYFQSILSRKEILDKSSKEPHYQFSQSFKRKSNELVDAIFKGTSGNYYFYCTEMNDGKEELVVYNIMSFNLIVLNKICNHIQKELNK